ncbi:MAG TPA: hypothetical protein VFG50_01960 [Rhodothermales bacterium]|nr:hypothetical protein [Rhodothermales bacterium]
MPEIKRIGDLDISQDLDHQHRMWRVEHVGWGVMVLLVVAALLGLLGPGPLSNTTAGEESAPLRATYGRFDRYKSPSQMTVHIGPALVHDGKVELSINRAFFDRVDLGQVDPEPVQVAAGPNWFIYTFAVADASAPLEVRFHYEPGDAGPLRIAVAAPGAPPIRFTSFVYP